MPVLCQTAQQTANIKSPHSISSGLVPRIYVGLARSVLRAYIHGYPNLRAPAQPEWPAMNSDFTD